MFDSGGPPLLPKLATDLSSALLHIGRNDISEQILRVVVPPQTLAGDKSQFSFLAYPWPRLTYEQRRAMSLRECESLAVTLENATVEIELDDFGQINWLRVRGAPTLFEEMSALIHKAVL